MPELHPAQFSNQMALPGMEQHAHPWAGPLSKGYMLRYAGDQDSHQLHAVNPQWPHSPDAYLEWGSRHSVGRGDRAEGEIHSVMNHVKGTEAGHGLAGALMRSAHHFDFGQDTVPVHSELRSPEGKAFSDRVMPELKPTIWRNMANMEVRREDTGEKATPGETRNVSWPGAHDMLHPFQRRQASAHQAAVERETRKPPQKERLF